MDNTLVQILGFIVLFLVGVSDYKKGIIKDSMCLFLIGLGVVCEITEIDNMLNERVTTCIITAVILLIVGAMFSDGLGGGDIKFISSLGFLMGFHMLLISLLIGCSMAIVTYLFKKAIKIPLGPCIGAGVVIATVFCNNIYKF